MPEIVPDNEDFATFGKEHTVSADNHKSARFSVTIPSEMRPFCLTPTEAEDYFPYLSYKLIVSSNKKMKVPEGRTAKEWFDLITKKASPLADQKMEIPQGTSAQIQENNLYLHVYKKERPALERKVDENYDSEDEMEDEDHIQYTFINSAGELVHGKTKTGLNGIKDSFSQSQLESHLSKFKVQILRQANRDNQALSQSTMYKGIRCEPHTLRSEERRQLVAEDPVNSYSYVQIPQGSVGLISNNGKFQYISPGLHLFTLREPEICFIRTLAINEENFPQTRYDYEGIPCEAQTLSSPARQQLVANDPAASVKYLIIPEGSIGLIQVNGKDKYIGPGEHIFTTREPGIVFVKTESINQMHIQHGNRHIIRVLPHQVIFVQSQEMGEDDYKLLMPMSGVYVFDLDHAYIVPLNDPYGQDITVNLSDGKQRLLFAKTAQGKGGPLLDGNRLTMLPPGVTQIHPRAQFGGRISTKNSLLKISIKNHKDKSGRFISLDKDGQPINIEATIQYRLVKPYLSILEFGLEYGRKLTIKSSNIAKLIEEEAKKILMTQIKSLISVREIAANKADYTFYEGVIVREVQAALNKRLIRETETLVHEVIKSLTVSLKKSAIEGLMHYLDDGTLDSRIISNLRGRLREGPFNHRKTQQIINDLRELEPTIAFTRYKQADKDYIVEMIRSGINDLNKPLNKPLITSLIDKLNNGIFPAEVVKRFYQRLNQETINRDVVLDLIEDLKRAELTGHTVVSKVSLSSISPADPAVYDQLEKASAQAITTHSNFFVKDKKIANDKMAVILRQQQEEVDRLQREVDSIAGETELIKAQARSEVSKILQGTPGAAELYNYLSQNKDGFFQPAPSDLKQEQAQLTFQANT